jgi:hypothetical protein
LVQAVAARLVERAESVRVEACNVVFAAEGVVLEDFVGSVHGAAADDTESVKLSVMESSFGGSGYTDWVLRPLEVKASSQTSSHQTWKMLASIHFKYRRMYLTILNPSITKSVNTLRLILSNDAVAQSRTRKKIEDGISVSALSLFVAETRGSRVSLHLAIESSSSWNVDGVVGDNIALCHGESGHREGESMRRTGGEVSLGSIWCAFDFVLSLVDSGCLDQRWRDGCESGSGELHDEQFVCRRKCCENDQTATDANLPIVAQTMSTYTLLSNGPGDAAEP